jgi:hypothetical protein
VPVSSLSFAPGDELTDVAANRMAEATQPYTAYTPAVTGVTTSVRAGRWHRHGDKVTVDFQIALSAAPTGVVSMSVPVTATGALTVGPATPRGVVMGQRVGVSYNAGIVVLLNVSTVQFTTSASPSSLWSATVPVTWASGDSWYGTFTYEAA